jgi:hypothetical protein
MNAISPQGIGAVSLTSEGTAPIPRRVFNLKLPGKEVYNRVHDEHSSG